mgnify:CR=1 FL=1
MASSAHAHDHAAGEHGHGEHGSHHHVVSPAILLGTFAALMVLTVITVAATFVDLGGSMNLLLAMVIAVTKATLVCLYFMHLRWDRPLNSVIFFSSILFLGVFLWFAMLDMGAGLEEIRSQDFAELQKRIEEMDTKSPPVK